MESKLQANRLCGRWLIGWLPVTVCEVAFVILGYPPQNRTCIRAYMQRERHERYKYLYEKMHMMRSNMMAGVVYCLRWYRNLDNGVMKSAGGFERRGGA